MKIYTLKQDAFAMGGGKKDPTFGYSYRAFVEESDLPIQFSSHSLNFVEGTKIIAETSEEKQAKTSGNLYLWLKGVKKEEDGGSEVAQKAPFQASQEPSTAFKPKSSIADFKYLKDASGTPVTLYNGSLHYAKELGLNLISNPDDLRVYLEYVKTVTDEMLDWIERIRSGEQLGAETTSSVPTRLKREEHPAADRSLGDEFRKRAITANDEPLPEEEY